MTAAMPARTDVRDCRLYRFYGWDPATNYTTKTLLYVGETVRQPLERLLEHLYAQPWAETITSWEVDDRVFTGKQAVLAAEAAAIRAERPLYNVVGNLENPVRVPPPTAIRQRRARDARSGRARWVHPDDRAPGPVPAAVRWTPARVKAALWAGAWLLETAAVWALLWRHEVVPGWPRLAWSASVALVLLVWSLAGAPVSKRQWRKVRRRGWRRWRR